MKKLIFIIGLTGLFLYTIVLFALIVLFSPFYKNNDPVVPVSEQTANRVVERAKCRNVIVEDEEVKIKFLNSEDAEIFAGDLKNLLNNK